MSEAIQEHPDQNILDALVFAFQGDDFVPMPQGFIDGINQSNSFLRIVSGSARFRRSYDFQEQRFVHALESYIIIESDFQQEIEDHRIAVWWDGDTAIDEYTFDDMEVIFDPGEEITEEKIVSKKQRIMQALRAVMTD